MSADIDLLVHERRPARRDPEGALVLPMTNTSPAAMQRHGADDATGGGR